ncbi:NADH-quinone oxidoreductase subunit L [Streptacidiphilus pinicola]|uniref:NADH-quinone oxidoreductase subunit L n=1 Tax=Streptacidiphilus pinicola TaxID=2219663 RepID=A0A2X0K064_9ACTN|nr:NADH-quinone oxidoreductase subunit L [Streptacidiphilus pinicola]RAG80710.1 NADH-quinone oxidoreductase subunit L [Streptacidiphilus pinicola]
MTLTLAILVPLLPFLGALAGLAAGRRAPGMVRPLAVLPTLASVVLAVLVAVKLGTGHHLDAATQLTPTGGTPISLSLHLDGIAALLAVLVTVVAACVQIYSTAYLREDPRYPSYAALVSLFTAAMLLVVYSGDLIVLLVGWEVMGVCSYFLVGHHWERSEARSASIKAFLVTKLGDVPFLFGIFVLAADAGTFRINGIVGAAAGGHLHHATLAALLLLGGVAGKSAQFPLHTWLPDAMAGPTPVSALIHAATMVAAGVYLVARLEPVFLLSTAALVVLGVMAVVTMVGSALCALAQDDMKRVLAYSTVGQLGYMAGALAVGDRDAALFHLITHGAFKALLFLAAGVVIHAVHTNSLTAMGRMDGLRRRVPDAYATMGIGLAALAGLPPFSGFFSKDAILTAAEHAARGEALTGGLGPAGNVPSWLGWTVLVGGLLTALLTAAYATRLWLLAFFPVRRAEQAGAPVAPTAAAAAALASDEPAGPVEPAAMKGPLWLLAVPSLALGLVGLWPHALPAWLDGVALTPSGVTWPIATVVALLGAGLAWLAWRRATARVLAEAEADPAAAADPAPLLLGPLLGPARTGFGIDTLYDRAFVRPVLGAARLVSFLDREVVETYVKGAAVTPGLIGRVVRRAQNGNIQGYLSALAAGVVVLAVIVAVAQ